MTLSNLHIGIWWYKFHILLIVLGRICLPIYLHTYLPTYLTSIYLFYFYLYISSIYHLSISIFYQSLYVCQPVYNLSIHMTGHLLSIWSIIYLLFIDVIAASTFLLLHVNVSHGSQCWTWMDLFHWLVLSFYLDQIDIPCYK